MEQSNRAPRDRSIILAAASDLATLLGRNCRERRANLKISQAELSRRSGVAVSHLSKIENGLGNPTLEVMEAIAEALDCSLVELLRA